MPIRFRCQYCEQLLGIARRKAGSTVRCPTCQAELLVPHKDQEGLSSPPGPALAPAPAPAPAPPSASAPAPALFERDDFDAILRGSVVPEQHRPLPAPPAPAAPRPQPAPPPPPAVPDSNGWHSVSTSGRGLATANGVVLSPARATVLTVVVIVLLAVAFALGLVVGRFLL